MSPVKENTPGGNCTGGEKRKGEEAASGAGSGRADSVHPSELKSTS